MEFNNYLPLFKKAADKLDKKLLHEKQIEVAVGIVLDSVFLKLYKKSWANPSQDPLTAESRIFFSVWINDSTIAKQKISYNIHAFKLRKLKGYTIESRKFAETFRAYFKNSEPKWENVSVDFGPLTLMEGWMTLDEKKTEDDLLQLSRNFLEIEHLIDSTLTEFRKV